jgi:hypothetical protein
MTNRDYEWLSRSVTTPMGTKIPDYYENPEGVFTSWDEKSRSYVPAPRETANELCHNSALKYVITEGFTKWDITVTFDNKSHNPLIATIVYTYRGTGAPAGIRTFAWASQPSNPPTNSFTAYVNFDQSDWSQWDIISIVTADHKSVKVDRNDVTRPLPAAFELIRAAIHFNELNNLIGVCKMHGLL